MMKCSFNSSMCCKGISYTCCCMVPTLCSPLEQGRDACWPEIRPMDADTSQVCSTTVYHTLFCWHTNMSLGNIPTGWQLLLLWKQKILAVCSIPDAFPDAQPCQSTEGKTPLFKLLRGRFWGFFAPQGRHAALTGVKFGTKVHSFLPNFNPIGAMIKVSGPQNYLLKPNFGL